MEVFGSNNILINGNNNSINEFKMKNKKPRKSTKKVYRRSINLVDFLFVFNTFILVFLVCFLKFDVEFAFLLVTFSYLVWYLLPFKFDSFNVSIFNNFFAIGKKKIFFKDIRWYQYEGSVFSYKFHNDDKTYSVIFYQENKSEYLFYKMDEYAIYNNTKI